VFYKKLDFDPDPEMDQDLDPELPEKSDSDPEIISLDPTHYILGKPWSGQSLLCLKKLKNLP